MSPPVEAPGVRERFTVAALAEAHRVINSPNAKRERIVMASLLCEIAASGAMPCQDTYVAMRHDKNELFD
jgi:hypothetical protein